MSKEMKTVQGYSIGIDDHGMVFISQKAIGQFEPNITVTFHPDQVALLARQLREYSTVLDPTATERQRRHRSIVTRDVTDMSRVTDLESSGKE